MRQERLWILLLSAALASVAGAAGAQDEDLDYLLEEQEGQSQEAQPQPQDGGEQQAQGGEPQGERGGEPAQAEPYEENVAVEQEPEPLPEQSEPPRATMIDEIVVTAQKRAQRLVDVPINVSSLSGDTMRNVKVEQVRDVAGYIPNVDIKEQVPGAIPVVSIRGVGLDDFSSTNSPAAGIYVDEVPLSSLALMSFDLYDMERIEVLKGPQGTLYGRNSTAGAINVLSAKPTFEREGFAKLGYGSYEALDFEGMFNQPLGDTLGLRIAGKYIRQNQGFWKSRFNADGTLADGTTPPVRPAGAPTGLFAILGAPIPPSTTVINHTEQPVARDIGQRDILLGRVRLGWDATTTLRFDLKVEGLRQRSELGQPENFGTNCNEGAEPIDPDNCADGLNYQDNDRDPYLGDWADEFPYTIDQTSYLLTANWDLGEASFTSVSGLIDLERFFHIDVDAQPADQFNFLQADDVRQFSQELRLAGSTDTVDWLGGLFYSDDQVDIETEGRHQDLVDGLASLILADQYTQSAAGFVNFDWHLTPAWGVTTGLRYTWETRHYVGGTTWTFEIPNNIENTNADARISDRNWSWKLGTNYALGGDGLVFLNVSKGVKSGGFFSGVTTDQRQLDPYKPEELLAYEIGAKWQGALSLNGSIFRYDYKDVQVFMRSNEVPVQFIGNVDKAEITGADLDAVWRGFDGLTLQLGVGVLRTSLGAFLGPSGTQVPEGNRLANAPELTFNGLLRYEFPVFGRLLLAAQFDAHYADSVFKEATNDPLIAADPYWIYNARLSLLPDHHGWDVSVWGRNLTDELYVVQGLDIGAFRLGNRNFSAPRTAGIEFSMHFQ